MSTQHKRNQRRTEVAITNTVTSSPSVSTPMATVSTPNMNVASNTTQHSHTSDTMSSTPTCVNPFICGQQNNELKNRIKDLENRIAFLEETAVDKRRFLKKAESLLTVFRVILIAMPISLCASIAAVQYFFYQDNKLLNIVTSLVGLAAIAECILLPILWKGTADKVDKLEAMFDE